MFQQIVLAVDGSDSSRRLAKKLCPLTEMATA
jgi:hypothetical protein